MATKRTGLGRGIGALIPSGEDVGVRSARPVDVFFPDAESTPATAIAAVEQAAAAVRLPLLGGEAPVPARGRSGHAPIVPPRDPASRPI